MQIPSEKGEEEEIGLKKKEREEEKKCVEVEQL